MRMTAQVVIPVPSGSFRTRLACLVAFIAGSALLLPGASAQTDARLSRRRPPLPSASNSQALVATQQGTPAALPDNSGHYRFLTIDVPGSAGTSAYGLNNEGLVSGFYFDQSSNLHGFLWRDDNLSLIDYPGSVDTALGDSTNAGVVIGNYGDLSVPVQHAALYDVASGTWTLLPDVSGDAANFGNGINNHGVATGAACTSVSCVGWTWDGREYSLFQAPGADPANGGTYPNGINDRNVVAGQVTDTSGVTHGFLEDEDEFMTLDVPGASNTFAFDVNDREETVGYYIDANGSSHGFLEKHGRFARVDYPNAQLTVIYGENSRGDLAGTYLDAASALHGFVALKRRAKRNDR